MMIKLYSLLIVATLTQIATSDQSKLIVVKQPSNQVYDYSSPLKLSDLSNIILAANGLSIDKTPEWKGLKTTNPLSIPKATILFLVNSNSINDSFASQFVTINEDTALDLPALESKLGADVTVRSFENVTADLKSLENDCSGQLSSVFYVIKVSDTETQDLNHAINSVSEKFNKFCVVDQSNDLLIYVLATSQKHVVKRQAQTPKILVTNSILNAAIFYSDQYPAIFNLLFWTSLLIALAVFAIVYGMFNMDPGLDTVIYRMTSQRIKKDN